MNMQQQPGMTGGPGGGPTWANPNPQPVAASAQEEEFFAPLSTLDEPVMETIMRDVQAVSSKLKVVLLPLDSNVSLEIGPSRIVFTLSILSETELAPLPHICFRMAISQFHRILVDRCRTTVMQVLQRRKM